MMLKAIENNLRERMQGYTDSRQPTDDEVRIAWLFSEVDRLSKEVTRLNRVITDAKLIEEIYHENDTSNRD